MSSISDLYKYSVLATAAYVRMGAQSVELQTDGATFAREANDQSDGRLPSSIANYLFALTDQFLNLSPWTIAHYHAGDTGLTPDDTGLGATLFQKGKENVLAIRGEGAPA